MKKQSAKTPIPWEYLLQMSTHEVTIISSNLMCVFRRQKYKNYSFATNCEALLQKYITDFRSLLDTTTAKIVGLDIISFNNDKFYSYDSRSRTALILCVSRRCLIVHLDYDEQRKQAPESLDNFLNDPNICFVGITKLPSSPNLGNFSNVDVGVTPGELADRVLRNSYLCSSSIAHLSDKLGFTYVPSKLIKYNGVIDIKHYGNYLTVFSNNVIIAAATNAYAYYQIGFKLLSSLQKDN